VLKQAPLCELLSAIRSVAAGQMWMSPALLTVLFSEYRADADELRAREQLNRLTPRELEVLRLMVSGYNRRDIASQLHVSSDTVRTHAQSLEKKLRVHSAVAAVSIALQAGLRPDH
jgi:DNA-binding NarL/FixJ family response regulator